MAFFHGNLYFYTFRCISVAVYKSYFDMPPKPLAEQLRPKHWKDIIGQTHLLGPAKPLRLAFESGHIQSCILWGPPGVGKTSIARIMAHTSGTQFITMSAVLGGVKDIRIAVEKAKAGQLQGKKSLVFVDEVHRFNKAQQDAFLPHVESGLFTFIGATTENPSFEVNTALLSRATVYVLYPLEHKDLQILLEKAYDFRVIPPLSTQASDILIRYADGDARRLLNTLETLSIAANGKSTKDLDEQWLQKVLGTTLRRYDKQGERFYDTISALHKSIRGSDANASLYWLVCMLDGGVDPRYLARRLIRIATEDIGLADPRALTISLQATQVYERLGSPEGELALAECVVYLAVAPKSNAIYKAFKAASVLVKQEGTRPVPLHLRNAPTQLMKNLGYGQDYRYAHDEENAFAIGEHYFPEGLEPHIFYQPVERGLEIKIAEKIRRLRESNQNHQKPQ
jgi:putative ATPase